MKRLVPVLICAAPGLIGALAGVAWGRPGVILGGAWAALVGAVSALWLITPLGGGIIAQTARLGAAFLTRLVGALLVAAGPASGRLDSIVTLIACLLAAMAAEMVLLLRAQEPARA